ncbi:hypothetical protein O181_108153 [Austropuccinia psidii MF-1]|uniref:Uncharacterized protein n=1 Tax=Austropuccinia psidii MF-1 TaxID=1389203 RepID=A0A9Q3JTT7_9BASI|nr:hypothetical protein [Austropuccinia psidii MF-1]
MSKISTKKEKETYLKTQPPTSRMLNEFKPETLVICTPLGFTDLDNLSSKTLIDTINGILKNMVASVDSKPFEIWGIKCLPLKELKIYTSTQSEAQWLFLNKHNWKSQLNSNLKTHPSCYPALINGIPKEFKPEDSSHLLQLRTQHDSISKMA